MRVQDITEEEAIAEGIERCQNAKIGRLGDQYGLILVLFADLWNKIYGPGAWDRNDWCWKIKFRRIHEND